MASSPTRSTGSAISRDELEEFGQDDMRADQGERVHGPAPRLKEPARVPFEQHLPQPRDSVATAGSGFGHPQIAIMQRPDSLNGGPDPTGLRVFRPSHGSFRHRAHPLPHA